MFPPAQKLKTRVIEIRKKKFLIWQFFQMMGIPFTNKMIYPKQFPAVTNDISSEHHFYRRFAREMDSNQNVYYSLTLITPDVPMREIDFVVVNPYGIVTIELKNGRWKVNRGKWEFYNVRERNWKEVEGKSYSGPIEQATTQLSLFKEFLKNHNGLENFFPEEYYDCALFFLKNEKNEFYLKNNRNPWIFGKDELEDGKLTLQEIIDKIQDKNNRKPLDENILKKIHQVLVKNLNFISDLKRKSNSEDDKLLALTKEQFSLISEITKIDRSIVYGVPGSGKSILAGQFGLTLAEEGKTVVIWQGSSSLYKLWKEELENLNHIQKPIVVNKIEEINQYQFDFLIIDQVEEWVENHSLYDLFLFLSEIFWINKKWSWFLSRKLKNSNSEIISFLEKTPHKSWDIIRNIRNSPEISQFANKISNGDGGVPVLENLTDVQLVSVNADEILSEKLKWCFGYAKKILGVSSEEIRVICPNKQYQIDHPDLDKFLKEHSISFLTLAEFSGMEDSCGMIVGFEGWHLTKTRSEIAKAVLLFRDLVCVLYNADEENELHAILQKSGSGP